MVQLAHRALVGTALGSVRDVALLGTVEHSLSFTAVDERAFLANGHGLVPLLKEVLAGTVYQRVVIAVDARDAVETGQVLWEA